MCGGVGAAKLLIGVSRALAGKGVTAIVNTADDDEIYGVHVAPDLDTITYWLAGLADTERGWGIAGDTFEVVEGLRELGADAWFNLGDRDFATCLLRTSMLRSGSTLTEVTAHVTQALGVVPALLPMTDDRVRTRVTTGDGRTLSFQEYFVKERCAPDVAAVSFEGAEDAAPGPRVLDAIEGADLVVVCPSNPVVSIGPLLAIPGIEDALTRHPFVVCVSPIVGGEAIKGPAGRMLASLAHGSSATAVARLYAGFCDHFVVDERDAAEVEPIRTMGLACSAMDTMMVDGTVSEKLARNLLALR